MHPSGGEGGMADERGYLLNLLCVAEELVMHLPERVQKKYGLVKGTLAMRHGGMHMIAQAGGSAVMASLSTGIQPAIAFPAGLEPIMLTDGARAPLERRGEELAEGERRSSSSTAPSAARSLEAQLAQHEEAFSRGRTGDVKILESFRGRLEDHLEALRTACSLEQQTHPPSSLEGEVANDNRHKGRAGWEGVGELMGECEQALGRLVGLVEGWRGGGRASASHQGLLTRGTGAWEREALMDVVEGCRRERDSAVREVVMLEARVQELERLLRETPQLGGSLSDGEGGLEGRLEVSRDVAEVEAWGEALEGSLVCCTPLVAVGEEGTRRVERGGWGEELGCGGSGLVRGWMPQCDGGAGGTPSEEGETPTEEEGGERGSRDVIGLFEGGMGERERDGEEKGQGRRDGEDKGQGRRDGEDKGQGRRDGEDKGQGRRDGEDKGGGRGGVGADGLEARGRIVGDGPCWSAGGEEAGVLELIGDIVREVGRDRFVMSAIKAIEGGGWGEREGRSAAGEEPHGSRGDQGGNDTHKFGIVTSTQNLGMVKGVEEVTESKDDEIDRPKDGEATWAAGGVRSEEKESARKVKEHARRAHEEARGVTTRLTSSSSAPLPAQTEGFAEEVRMLERTLEVHARSAESEREAFGAISSRLCRYQETVRAIAIEYADAKRAASSRPPQEKKEAKRQADAGAEGSGRWLRGAMDGSDSEEEEEEEVGTRISAIMARLSAPLTSRPPSSSARGAAACRVPSDRPGASRAPSDRPGASRTPSDRPGASRAPSDRPGASRVPSDRPGASRAPSDRPGASRVPSDRPGASRVPSDRESRIGSEESANRAPSSKWGAPTRPGGRKVTNGPGVAGRRGQGGDESSEEGSSGLAGEPRRRGMDRVTSC